MILSVGLVRAVTIRATAARIIRFELLPVEHQNEPFSHRLLTPEIS